MHFNRGAAASQEYTRLFGDKRPEDVGPAVFTWLSRGAAESIADFIGRAVGPGWGWRVGAYEFTDENVLRALGAARDRGADVEVLYHAKERRTKDQLMRQRSRNSAWGIFASYAMRRA